MRRFQYSLRTLLFTLLLFLPLLIPAVLWAGRAGVTGFIISVFLLWSYFRSTATKRVLNVLNARPIERTEYRILHERVEKLGELLKLREPLLYMYESLEKNAVTLSFKNGLHAVMISTGMLNTFNLSELEEVLLREMKKTKGRELTTNIFFASMMLFLFAPLTKSAWQILFSSGNKHGKISGLFDLLYSMVVMPYIYLIFFLDPKQDVFSLDDEMVQRDGSADLFIRVLSKCSENESAESDLTKLALNRLYFSIRRHGNGILLSTVKGIDVQDRFINLMRRRAWKI